VKNKFIAAMCFVFCSFACAGEQKLSYVDLVGRITDLEQVSVLPVPGEKCAQFSSYDRASKYDEATGKYIRWDSNGDGGAVIRMEGDQAVLAEMNGPGCIWRTWSATAGKGHVKIYLDGASEAAVDLAFDDYFSRKFEPFTYPALVYKTAANGFDNYVPMPFQKSCKIIGDKGWGNYYHFTYSNFPAGTQVPTFKRELSAEEKEALGGADRIFAVCNADPAGKRKGEKTVVEKVSVEAGKTAKVLDLTGEQAITAIKMKMDLPASPADRDILRELSLKITWDGDKEPAVWTPLGDFFGSAPGANKYSSLPLGLTADGTWYCYWYMPFKKSALLELTNDGKTKLDVNFEITYAPLTKPIETLGRFHAKWHRDAFPPAEPERAIDWTMLKTEGTGRFCGVMLHVWNPCGDWWGEGDEKFFVDGEKFPSTFGTGSEDYFGYAWSSGRIFFQALHNQPNNENNNKGHLSVNRWQIADNVPFQKSYEGVIEKYFTNKRPTLFSCITYWYQNAGSSDPYKPLPVEERVMASYPSPYTIEGATEFEFMPVLEKTGGNSRSQDMSNFKGKWGYGQQFFWTDTKKGDKLTFKLQVKDAGKYDVIVQLTKANDYGIVQMYMDGEKLGEQVDCYNSEVGLVGELKLGTKELTAGDHKFTVEIAGANEKSNGRYFAGLDYIRLGPVK
jgi:hypothetical protein